MAQVQFYGTGRRKKAVAKVYLRPGSGKITVNNRDLDNYIDKEVLKTAIYEPFEVTENIGKFDVLAKVSGGGITGQAGAIRLAVARALIEVDENLRPSLKKAGLLTRDPRMKERKKYGFKKARKSPQFSKR